MIGVNKPLPVVPWKRKKKKEKMLLRGWYVTFYHTRHMTPNTTQTVVSWRERERKREKWEGWGWRGCARNPHSTWNLHLAIKYDSKPNKRIMAATIFTQESVCMQPCFFLFWGSKAPRTRLNTETPGWQIGETRCAHNCDVIDQKRRSKQEWR